jgi:lipoate-protein ligase A
MTDRIFPFARMALWTETCLGSGATHMALDETMLRLAEQPTMRIYRWAEHEVTFGYPQRWADARRLAGDRPTIRRCTGGGFVEHGEDLTISLTVPISHPFARLAPAETYHLIHDAIRIALGEGARLADEADCRCGAACFTSPARFDLMLDGKKILGGAQRRSREGFLYQGSLQGLPPDQELDGRIAAAMAATLSPWIAPDGWQALRDELVTSRYGNPDWNRRR